MKRTKYIILAILILGSFTTFAQNEIDALRYSQYFPVGTARSVGMGGATGSVGADFSGLSINPAGIGLYRKSEFTFSPSIYWNSTSSDFKGNSYEEVKYNFNLGNLGMVFNNNMRESGGWVSTSFGIGVNRINNFHQTIYMSGINNNSSYLDNFVNYANGNPPSNLNSYYEGLAFETYAIDTSGSTYFNDFNIDGYGQVQKRELKTKGATNEYVFSFGANYNHKLYIGATLGIQSVKYQQNVIHTESDPNDIIGYIDYFNFYETLNTRGVGYTFKIGAIARPLNFLRIGAAFHLPTFYNLKDEYSTDMETKFDQDVSLDYYEASSPLGDYKYQLRTPPRIILSATGTIGKLGMISADYEFVDYTKAELDANDYGFDDENMQIENLYRATQNLRLGGELRLGAAYLRAGYAIYNSPYATQEPNIKADHRILTAGFGIRSKYSFVDFSFSNNSNETRYYMYVPEMTDGSLNSSNANSIQVTMGFRF